MRNHQLSIILLLSLCLTLALGQSVELLISPTAGYAADAKYISSLDDTWHSVPIGGSNNLVKAAGGYLSLGTSVVNANTHEVVTADLKWPETEYDWENRVGAATVDPTGNLWVITSGCESKLYRVITATGEMVGPYVTVIWGASNDNTEIYYNNNKLYISILGVIYTGDQNTAVGKANGFMIVDLPETLPEDYTLPAIAFSFPVVPFQILHRPLRFDSEGRVYFESADMLPGAVTVHVIRWDGVKWEEVTFALSNQDPNWNAGVVLSWAVGYDDKIYIGGVFSALNGQPASNIAAFHWAENPTFDDLGGGVDFPVSSIDVDYEDDGTPSDNIYLASAWNVVYYNGETEEYTTLAVPYNSVVPISSIGSSRVKNGGDDGSDDSSSGSEGSDDGSDGSGSNTGSDDGSNDNGSDNGSSSGSGSDDNGSNSGSDAGSDSGSDSNTGSDDGSDDNGSDTGSDNGSDNGSGNGSDSGSDTGSDNGSDDGSGSDGGNNHHGENIVVLGNLTGWIRGGARYSWGTGGLCGLIVSRKGPSNTRQSEVVLRVVSGGKPPRDWFGCGQYYYHTHNNTFLDFSGVSALRFWIRSNKDVTVKVEVEFDASTSPTPPNSRSNPGSNNQDQDPKKAFTYINPSRDWVQVTLPLSDRSADELAHVYSPFIITVLGRGTVFIGDIEAVRD